MGNFNEYGSKRDVGALLAGYSVSSRAVAITDFATKSGNGHTLLEEIKALFPRIPVIVLTDKLSPIVKEFAFSMGAYALIEKPCSCEMLISCIRRSLKRNKIYQ